jgi:hypothetical protein
MAGFDPSAEESKRPRRAQRLPQRTAAQRAAVRTFACRRSGCSTRSESQSRRRERLRRAAQARSHVPNAWNEKITRQAFTPDFRLGLSMRSIGFAPIRSKRAAQRKNDEKIESTLRRVPADESPSGQSNKPDRQEPARQILFVDKGTRGPESSEPLVQDFMRSGEPSARSQPRSCHRPRRTRCLSPRRN